MGKRRKFVYTIWSSLKQKRYIVTSKQFEDRLALALAKTDYVVNGIGVSSADYIESRKAIRQMKKPNHGGYVFSKISFAVYDEEAFNKRSNRGEYVELKESVYSL